MRAAAIAMILLVLAACSGGEDSIFHNIPEQGWAYTQGLDFQPVDGHGELYLALRHDASYPYANLWLEVASASPVDSLPSRRDTINLTLCDSYGRWLGKGFGGSYQMEVKVADDVTLDSGSVVIVRHIMRIDTLRGIDQIGIRLSVR